MVEPATIVIIGAGIALVVTAIIAGVAIAFPPTTPSSSEKIDYKAFLASQRPRTSTSASNKKKDFEAYRHENDHEKLL